jgi:hypothetical protein
MRYRRFAIAFALLLAMPLAGCGLGGMEVGSLFKSPLATRPGVVDPGAAVQMVSAYRRSHGLGPVVLSDKLTRIAAVHAKRMAASDRVDHVLPGEGSFPARMSAGGYNASVAAENIGAGYDSLAEAMEGWRKSPHHNDNLLRPGVTEIGIALSVAPDSKYKTYWSLVLASPYRPNAEGPNAGPVGMINLGQ